MKFFSYKNNNDNYSKAISLQNVRTVTIKEGSGKSVVRFFIEFTYYDGKIENFNWLQLEEAERVFKNIISALNEENS